MPRSISLSAVVAVSCGLALTATVADAKGPTIKRGYYSSLVGVPSADVEFHVSAGNRIKDLAFTCKPSNTRLIAGTGYDFLAFHVHPTAVRNGRISFHGTATIPREYLATGKPMGAKLSIHLTHVNGPVRHYTYNGNHFSQTRAWIGTAGSPLCGSVPAGGHVTLYGPSSDN